MDATGVREAADALPREPGVYHFVADRVLYVGKAVDLRDRVRSYADPRSARIAQMVERAESIEFSVTDTETQALLLEANLIKRHQPPYNVRLKDDKSYPLVQLTDHPVPRIEVTRDPEEGATVYGPFTDKGRVETVVKALRETYGLRGCSDHKYEGRDRPCLDYEMGLCTAPCTGEIGPADYAEDVASVERFFGGETGVLADPLRREMAAASEAQEFERAANCRDELEAVEAFHGDADDAVQTTRDERAVDVLGAVREGERATVARLHAADGQLIDRERHGLDAPDGDGVGEVLSAFITQYYAEREFPEAVLCSERPGEDVVEWLAGEGVDVRVPGAGREATLVDLALKNARRGGPARDDTAALADALALDSADRIEGFDVSHAQGRAVVGSNVAFVNGDAAKRDYRRKKLTERNDDYANMRELVRWRAKRAIEDRDDRPDPDLLLIDGGDGQLGAARDALAETGWDVPAVALAKDEELVVTPTGTHDWDDDPKLHLCQRVRDEAHRFAVQYHQTVRDEVTTALDDVPGVGPETRKRLLRRFGSVDNVRAASTEELLTVEGVGEATAATLQSRLS
ncbi:excinuclease ABC subunit C [Halomicrobium katesii]|uniref:excinuclease ABC subunit C n=1 Tax=Halomicrobium katesii TaxID=437163 RepID=UPI0003727CC4|nr:excinuclease ABC subunit C [Halomicrobium katesii]